MLQIYGDSNVSGKKGFRYIKKFKEISLNKIPSEAKVKLGSLCFGFFTCVVLSGTDERNDTVDIPYRYIVYGTIY